MDRGIDRALAPEAAFQLFFFLSSIPGEEKKGPWLKPS
jgi:hypothetical protein